MGARKAALTKIYILNLLAKHVKDVDLAGSTDEESGVKLLVGILSAIDEKNAGILIDRLIDGVSVNNGDTHEELATVLDDHFAGNLTELYKVMYFVAEVNYPDFLGEKGLVGKIITKVAQPKNKTQELQK